MVVMNLDSTPEFPIVVLISGRGSNLQSIIDAVAAGSLPVTICAVISNRPDADGLQRARRAGIEIRVLDHRGFDDRESYDTALQKLIDTCKPRLVVLAGYMRILSPAFVAHYNGRLINIHPSLLPDFQGLHTHARALESGVRKHGASVHYVTEELDGGPPFLQVEVPVLENDTEESLAARVLEQEHRMYPVAIRWIAEGRVSMDAEGHVVLDRLLLDSPVRFQADTGQGNESKGMKHVEI